MNAGMSFELSLIILSLKTKLKVHKTPHEGIAAMVKCGRRDAAFVMPEKF